MRKIATLFQRDSLRHGAAIPVLSHEAANLLATGYRQDFVPTEKLDGSNIRLTLRNGQVVRTEKRRNPTNDQKADGIVEPWYQDASGDDPADQYLLEAAARVRGGFALPDGEHACEAVGPKIQGNPLGLADHMAVPLFVGRWFFERVPAITDFELSLESTPRELFDYTRYYLLRARSHLNAAMPIEGIVWQGPIGCLKIKHKDFR
jgi:hypothetical protein